jgi:hypothetical protein
LRELSIVRSRIILVLLSTGDAYVVDLRKEHRGRFELCEIDDAQASRPRLVGSILHFIGTDRARNQLRNDYRTIRPVWQAYLRRHLSKLHPRLQHSYKNSELSLSHASRHAHPDRSDGRTSQNSRGRCYQGYRFRQTRKVMYTLLNYADSTHRPPSGVWLQTLPIESSDNSISLSTRHPTQTANISIRSSNLRIGSTIRSVKRPGTACVTVRTATGSQEVRISCSLNSFDY